MKKYDSKSNTTKINLNNEKQNHDKKSSYWTIVFCLVIFVVLFNILSWVSPLFCDWYSLYVTRIIVNTFGRFSNLFTFSVGEVLITMGMLLIIGILILSLFLLFLHKNGKYKAFMQYIYKCVLMIILIVAIIMTSNCVVYYHCSDLDPNPNVSKRTYTVEEIEILRNYIVEQCNKYSVIMERDEEGFVIYQGNLQEVAKNALRNISEEYPKLQGFYPNVKKMFYSDLMSQSYMGGYYFPFSMEANYNGNMYIMNLPITFCHELSHLHGYIYENEADFLAYLACIKSDDMVFQYSAYLEALWHVDSDYYRSVQDKSRYDNQIKIKKQVVEDSMFLTPKTWENVEEHSVLDTDSVSEISDTFVNTSLKVNGVENGMAVYGDVVYELLEYYDGVLY